MPPAAPLKIIYITSRGHSGSTLLDLLISSHDQITSVGEIKLVGTDRVEPCGCGAASYAQCPFWQRVSATMKAEHGFGMDELQLNSDDPAVMVEHNQAMFRTVAALTGCNTIVDSSKNVSRLEQLLSCPDLQVMPIHLVREPFGVVYSNFKRGRDWRYHARNYTYAMFRTLEILDGRPHLDIRYEAVARHPRRELARVMRYIGLPLQERQFNWLDHEAHNVGGNPMRFSSSDEIRLDRSWRKGLSTSQKLKIAWMTLPARLQSRWIYDRARSWWDL